MKQLDIVVRLKTFVAPENWDADQLIFDATKEIERLRSAKSDSSQLDIEVESLKARVKELGAALRPFAESAKGFDSYNIKNPEEWFCYGGVQGSGETTGAITVGDLRRARAILEDRT